MWLGQTVPTELMGVTELCINMICYPNPHTYKYVRNANSNVLKKCGVSVICAYVEDVLCTRVGYTRASSRGEMTAQAKFLSSNHTSWKEYIPLICRSSTELAKSHYYTVPAGITGHKPLWIKLRVINPAGSQTHLPFSKPASSMAFALHYGVPTERN